MALLFGFCAWIMFQTFSYESESSTILIARTMWSDFAATLPLIRSFSMGDNWPPEYPIFPGPPIQYHYLFFLIVGKLEAMGLPLHWALNAPSVLGFFLLLLMIHLLAKLWFQDARVGVLGIAFFLFNGSMTFVQYFEKSPLSLDSIQAIVSSDRFAAMGPWDGGQVLGVWHLLVFVSQRHFSVALGVLLSFIYVCHKMRGRSQRAQAAWALLFGVLIGCMPLFNKAVVVVAAIVMSAYFFVLPAARRFLVGTGAIAFALLGLLWLLSFNPIGAPGGFGWYPGFMIHDSLTLGNALEFFWYQFGLHTVLIPIGCLLAPGHVRASALPAFIVFAMAFLFRFSGGEVLVGHKFFNFFLIVGQLFSGYAVVRAHDFLAERLPRGRVLAFGASAPLVFLLTVSGVIDFFPIVNASMVRVRDVGANPEAKWFAENTPRDAVVLSSQFFYPPPLIAGRKIFLGYAYFTDGAGYDSRSRRERVDAIYRGGERAEVCALLRSNGIEYVEVEDFERTEGRPYVNFSYFRANFRSEYVARSGRYAVYATSSMCP